MKPDSTTCTLDKALLPKTWYEIRADLPSPPPALLHPGTLQPLDEDALSQVFAPSLAKQELATQRDVEIPQPVRNLYAMWRPSPLVRARRLEALLDTPARIYFKAESASPTGSHKTNSGLAQAFFAKQDGISRITTETGGGQWGASLAYGGAQFGVEVDIFMVRVSYQQKPYRRGQMEVYGARCVPSPSPTTQAGKAILAQNPHHPGSLGVAVSEALELAMHSDNTRYCLGSVLNHVILHQTIIGQEALVQMELMDDYPDMVIGCAGGGSNFSGLAFPFLGKALREKKSTRFIAVEPLACPSLTRGTYGYDFGDVAGMTPLLKMHTLGATFTPPSFHAGGLRYHGMAPMTSHVYALGLIEATAVTQMASLEAGVQFARAEGIVPAPESCHAIRTAIDEALVCKREGKAKTILFNLSGHGHFDMQVYMDYLGGKLVDEPLDEAHLKEALGRLPGVGV
ncbi:MAG: TrpB-like pyridoxal phosphate-dependent enzyme [Cystobacterineae bacterium]|nr:TrpB-like pyridoxal phosphate-dependent enzyme [Cystobacterineae bacterium]